MLQYLLEYTLVSHVLFIVCASTNVINLFHLCCTFIFDLHALPVE